MDRKVLENDNRWLNSEKVDTADQELLKNYTQEQIDDAFFQDIKFGTAGMRGVLGPGTNRMNTFTIRKACFAFGKFLLSKYSDAKTRGVAISHDNRHMSREFTLECVQILNDMGIDTYIFDSLRPTPELSYAIRYQKCCGGIMITASHNPKEYNGFKVYDSFGCQLVPNKIAPLINIINTLPDELNIDIVVEKERGTNHFFDEKCDETYVELVKTVQVNPDLPKNNFKIVYSPNHGTSYVNAMRVFSDCGYEVYPVLCQCDPNPDFSGTKSPNPEDPISYEESIKLAKEVDADLICMTDPDGDRVGLACKDKNGEYVLLTGNESAAILIEYLFSEKSKKGLLSDNGVMYNTIVTSKLGEKIAADYGVKTESFLTGFKFIGDRIQYYEEHDGPTFEFGYEESYGCLIKPFVRDKDGIQAILAYCECALFYKLQGLTLVDVYEKLGEKYGHHKSKLFNIYFKGSDGSKKMASIIKELASNPLKELLGNKVVVFERYDTLIRKDFVTGDESNIVGLPSSDVLKFYFEDGTNIAVRPSGTEPKCKFYIEVVCKNLEDTKGQADKYFAELKKILKL